MDFSSLSKERKLDLIYRHTHADHKINSATFGRSILIARNGAICIVPLVSLTDKEISELLPQAFKQEILRATPRLARQLKN